MLHSLASLNFLLVICMISADSKSPNATFTDSETKNSCEDKKDGIYLYGPCATGYKKCIRSHELRYSCDPGLYYNAETGFCEDKVNVSGCSQESSEKTPSPSTEDDSCRDLPDGIHINSPCSPEFMVCKAGKVFYGYCGKGLLFNLETLRCDYTEKVLSCLPREGKNRSLPSIDDGFRDYNVEFDCFRCWYFIASSGSITIMLLLGICAYLFIEFKWKRSLFGHICNRVSFSYLANLILDNSNVEHGQCKFHYS